MAYSFKYRTRFGVFSIKPSEDGRWWLWMEDEALGSYHSPESAADDVYTQATGFYEWDILEEIMEPCDLSEWSRFNT